MKEGAIRLMLGLFLNGPAGVSLCLCLHVARRYARRSSHSSPGLAFPWKVAASSWAWPLLSAAIVVQVLGAALIGTRHENVARITTIYPSSAIFYVIPQRVIDVVPEPLLAFTGAFSAIAVTILLFVVVFTSARMLLPSRAAA